MLAKKAKEVLLEFQKAELLEDLILIGSWCGHFYISYFGKDFNPTIQTLDIDFLIPRPRELKDKQISVGELLSPLDFDSELSGSGWVRFIHPELRVEFLVPRHGPTSDDPRTISQLKIKAMPLRHTSALTEHTIVIEESNLKVRVPHPGAFALHKLFVSGRRKEKGKALRDRQLAYRILEALHQSKKEEKTLLKIWKSFTKKERFETLQVLKTEKLDQFDLGWIKKLLDLE